MSLQLYQCCVFSKENSIGVHGPNSPIYVREKSGANNEQEQTTLIFK